MGKEISDISLWQRWWSYFCPVLIERASSGLNEDLEVALVKGSLQLCTSKAVYSFEHKYLNFKLLFDQLDFTKLSGGNVLLLGLGLGSVVQLLEDKKNGLNYTAIEADEEVIRLAEDYILSKLNISIQTICTDGYLFPQISEDKYDLICMDIFIDDWIPEEFLTKDFCQSLHNILKDGGLVVFNTPAFNQKSAVNSKRFFNYEFKSIFPQSKLIEVHKNYMLINHSDLLHA